MVTQKAFDAYGVTASVYYFDKGDALKWHSHIWAHGHFVVRGMTFVEMADGRTWHQMPGGGNIELEAGVAHQITATEDNTIFVNVAKSVSQPAPLPNVNRVLMDDGTIVEIET